MTRRPLLVADLFCGAEAGAVVAVCEAEPLPLEGWHHVELTRSGGKPEWLTLSRAPARLPERLAQRGLFA